MIYADLEYLIEKIDWCKTNPESIFTAKVGENIPSDFSIFTNFNHYSKAQKINIMYKEVKIASL